MSLYVPDLNMPAANDAQRLRGRTVPLLETITPIPGYPSKLVIFKIAASKYWQVRCWMNGKSHRRSTKSKSIKLAQRYARWFYEILLLSNTRSLAPTGDQSIQVPNHEKTNDKKMLTFGAIAAQVYSIEESRFERGEISADTFRLCRNRLDSQFLPRFGHILCKDIDYKLIQSFTQSISTKYTTTTISHYLYFLRKLLTHAKNIGCIDEIPNFPKVKVRTASRGAFTPTEYWQIMRKARKLIGKTHPSSNKSLRKNYNQRYRDNQMPPDLGWAVGFMVNGFLRPGDLKKIKHKHIEVVRGSANTYLRLTLPETKRHDTPIVTLRPAVRIYEQICKHRATEKLADPEDYLFLPHIRDRNYALAVLSLMLNWVLAETGLKLNANGGERSFYSLRHSAITFRLLYGQGIDLITLARNARTSVEVINNHYASTVTGEQNIAMLQSRRTPN